MTTATLSTASLPAAGPIRVTTPRVVRAEVIKVLSLRSTWWTGLLTVAMMAGLAIFLAALIEPEFYDPATHTDAVTGSLLFQGYIVAQIVVIVLAALTITGEYSTGMIRSTLVAVPHRLPVLAAKTLVVTALVAAVSLVGTALGAVVAGPLLNARGIDVQVWSTGAWGAVLAGTGYLLGIALIALFVGALLRSSAGTIGAVLGLVLGGPMVFLGILGSYDWAQRIADLLPSTAERLARPEALGMGGQVVGQTQGEAALVLLAWVVALGVAAAVSLRSRDA